MRQGREEVQRSLPSGIAFRNQRCISSHRSLSRCQGILFSFSFFFVPERFQSLPSTSLLLLRTASPGAEHYSKVLPVLLSAGEWMTPLLTSFHWENHCSQHPPPHKPLIYSGAALRSHNKRTNCPNSFRTFPLGPFRAKDTARPAHALFSLH